jgi:hypothetical protein
MEFLRVKRPYVKGVLKEGSSQTNEIALTTGKWHLPYRIYKFIEFRNKVIVHYSEKELEMDPPYEGFYYGCTIWCYNKADKSIKWIIAEPPIARNANGNIWNRNFVPIPPDWPKMDRNESYTNIYYDKEEQLLSSDTTGARRFAINPNNGKVTLIVTGVR